MALTDMEPMKMPFGLAPSPFLGAYPTRLHVSTTGYMGKPAPEILHASVWDWEKEGALAWEFDLGGLVWRYRGGQFQTVAWSAVYYPFPRNAWDLLTSEARLYVYTNRVVADGHYHFTKIPEEWKTRWAAMEAQYSKARLYQKNPFFTYDEEVEFATVLNRLVAAPAPLPKKERLDTAQWPEPARGVALNRAAREAIALQRRIRTVTLPTTTTQVQQMRQPAQWIWEDPQIPQVTTAPVPPRNTTNGQ